MSKGPGRTERAIADLLEANKHMSAPVLAALIYQSEDELKAGGRPATAAELAAVRRSLANMQKRGVVVKLGNMFLGERCSYANRAAALRIAERYVRSFGLGSLRDHPALAELYADASAERGGGDKELPVSASRLSLMPSCAPPVAGAAA